MKSNLHKSLLVCGEYLSGDAVVVVGELPDELLLGVEEKFIGRHRHQWMWLNGPNKIQNQPIAVGVHSPVL